MALSQQVANRLDLEDGQPPARCFVARDCEGEPIQLLCRVNPMSWPFHRVLTLNVLFADAPNVSSGMCNFRR